MFRHIFVVLLLAFRSLSTEGFQLPLPPKNQISLRRSPLPQRLTPGLADSLFSSRKSYPPDRQYERQKKEARTGTTTTTTTRLGKFFGRLDTLKSAGVEDAKAAGVWARVKKLYGPKLYLALCAYFALRFPVILSNPVWYFVTAWGIKWYKARYVFKIPVWDRQPLWNNVITSKEQEKDLKAYTCKNCGTTLFIAKSREFYFEGHTGIGGLGCFTCGAKGKDNFVMDRDRIVEDVADMDDYFDYESPLDFVSRQERRALLKQTKGDEEAARKLLVEQQNKERGVITIEKEATKDKADAKEATPSPPEDETSSTASDETEAIVDEATEGDGEEQPTEAEEAEAPSPIAESETVDDVPDEDENHLPSVPEKEEPIVVEAQIEETEQSEDSADAPADDLDALGMDDF